MQLYNCRKRKTSDCEAGICFSCGINEQTVCEADKEVITELKILSAVYWDQGGRTVNQDSITLQQVMTAKGRVMMAAVSDGIGGLEEGENASGYITERLIENFYAQMVPLVGRRKGKRVLMKSLLRCFCDINENLKRYGKDKDIQLGATISLLFVWRRQYVIMHLGDSRIYFWSSYRLLKGRIKMLTEDHSDGSSRLSKCMGSFPFQYPDVRFGRLKRKSGFLLCTDGFYRRMGVEALNALAPGEISSEEQIYRRLREIAAASFKKGEEDNLSAVYAMVY